MPLRQKKKIVPMLLLALFFAWQIDALLHLLLTPHTVCEHGKIVDADPKSGHPRRDSQNKDNPNHKGCRVLMLLTSAQTQVSNDAPPGTLVDAHENKTFIIQNGPVFLHAEELFQLSPSNSPPHSC